MAIKEAQDGRPFEPQTALGRLLAGFSAGAPWTQAIGRLRCLVQGCCHGREADEKYGIRYTHPRSRVCRLTGFAGVPLHPTPLYSILWNLVVGIVVLRLWSLRASLPLIAGLYLVLNGLGRFVEEAYRGEPQTPFVGGLRLYQWLAVLSIGIDAFVTGIETPLPTPHPSWSPGPLTIGLGFGLIAGLAMGVDFPHSSRRFSRLA